MRAHPLAWILALALVVSCGSKQEGTEVASDGIGTAEDPIRLPTDPPEPGDTDEPGAPTDPTDPPPAQVKILEIPGQSFTPKEAKSLHLPYTKLLMPHSPLGKARDHKYCADGYENQCVVNRQVGFGFDLRALKGENPHTLVVHDMRIVMDVYSVSKNKRSELICSVDFRVCSGRAKAQNIVVTTFWQDGTFWKKQHDRTVLTSLFQDAIDKGKHEDGLYMVEGMDLSLKDLFKFRTENLKEYAVLKTDLKFTVSDDTYIEHPVLKIYYSHPQQQAL